MSKELTPLEALEELRHRITNFNGKFHNYNELMGTIETALKDYKTLKREYDFGVEHYNELLNKYNKEHKALEIIGNLPQEEKQVLLNAVYTYTKSEEEYDLLKEML